MQAEVRNPRWRSQTGILYISLYTTWLHDPIDISMFSRSSISMKLFLLLCDASGSQKSKMAAHKKGNTHLSACIQRRCTILTAISMFSRHSSYTKLLFILCDASKNSKSKMAAYKSEILTSQPLYNVAAKFQRLNTCFQDL